MESAHAPSEVADLARARLVAGIRRCAAGERAALQELYRDTSAKLYGVCLRILGDRTEAEDVLQETYIAVWRQAARFDPQRASPITWLATIARNRAIDRLRSSARFRSSEPIEAANETADCAPLASEVVARSQEHAALLRCLGELEPQQADCVRTAFFEGLTYDALAKRMGVPPGTMKSWMRRSLMRLRGCLEGGA